MQGLCLLGVQMFLCYCYIIFQVLIVITISLGISFMQGIYTYIP